MHVLLKSIYTLGLNCL